MIIKTLYRYTVGGKTTVSPTKPDADYTETYRVVAEDGMAITDGIMECECIDTDYPNDWHDCESSAMTEEEKLAEAARILMGVK